jgi:hypothetical protein
MDKEDLILAAVNDLRETMSRRMDRQDSRIDGQDVRLRLAEDTLARLKGSKATLVGILAAAGGAGGIAGVALAWAKQALLGGKGG